MNYQHAFHAGNHADLLKHMTLAALGAQLAEKPKPLTFIDFFAGSGVYDLLLDDRAQRGGEWRSAAEPIWRAGRAAAPAAVNAFWRALDSLNGSNDLRFYPGSPHLLHQLLREGDKLFCVEAKASEADALAAALGRDSRVKIQTSDGWAAVESLLPPTPRRGLALIDPPYEKPGEYSRATAAVRRGLARWATGVFALWWPETAQTPASFEADLAAAAGATPLLKLSLGMTNAPTGLKRSHVAIVNPPYQADAATAAIGAYLAETLGGAYAQIWLTPPR